MIEIACLDPVCGDALPEFIPGVNPLHHYRFDSLEFREWKDTSQMMLGVMKVLLPEVLTRVVADYLLPVPIAVIARWMGDGRARLPLEGLEVVRDAVSDFHIQCEAARWIPAQVHGKSKVVIRTPSWLPDKFGIHEDLQVTKDGVILWLERKFIMVPTNRRSSYPYLSGWMLLHLTSAISDPHQIHKEIGGWRHLEDFLSLTWADLQQIYPDLMTT